MSNVKLSNFSNEKKKRFVIVDPSIAHNGGHYLEYARRAGRIALEKGYEVHLATNHVFDSASINENFVIHKLFRYDCWNNNPNENIDLENRVDDAMWEVRFRFSRLGQMWHALNYKDRLRQYNSNFAFNPQTLKRFRSLAAIKSLFEADGNEESVLDTAPEFYRFKQKFVAAKEVARRHHGSIVFGSVAENKLPQEMNAISRQSHHFFLGLRDLKSEIFLDESDIWFFPNLMIQEITGFRRFLLGVTDGTSPTFKLLFRRNVYELYPESFQRQEYSVHQVRTAIQSVAMMRSNLPIQFFTDTDPLSAQYGLMNSGIFRTVPIPVGHIPLVSSENFAVGYFGDAREEKGFHWLVHLDEACKNTLTANLYKKIKFLYQCYTPKNHVDLHIHQKIAMLKVQSGLNKNVTLINHSLDSDEYINALESVGIILIPYLRENYIARSSGIFAEALAAGIPVVVTAGTWMSEIIDRQSYPVHRDLILDDEVCAEIKGANLNWNVEVDNCIPIYGKMASFTIVPVIGNATHMWLTFDILTNIAQTFTRLVVSFRDQFQKEILQFSQVIGGGDFTQSVVLPIPENAHDVWIGCYNNYGTYDYALTNVRLRFIRSSKNLPRWGIGVVFDTEDLNLIPTRIAESIREIFERTEFYRHAARGYASDWREQMSSNRMWDLIGDGEFIDSCAADQHNQMTFNDW